MNQQTQFFSLWRIYFCFYFLFFIFKECLFVSKFSSSLYIFNNWHLHTRQMSVSYLPKVNLYLSPFSFHIFMAAQNCSCFYAMLKLIISTSFSQISKLLSTRKCILVFMLWLRQAYFQVHVVHIYWIATILSY